MYSLRSPGGEESNYFLPQGAERPLGEVAPQATEGARPDKCGWPPAPQRVSRSPERFETTTTHA